MIGTGSGSVDVINNLRVGGLPSLFFPKATKNSDVALPTTFPRVSLLYTIILLLLNKDN